MATDSTELTFVRCPSCRSLVPAVYSRCKMCGAALDGVTRSVEQDNLPTGKVKAEQNIVSQRASSEQTEPVDRHSSNEGLEVELQNDQPPFDDPLSAYIEEVDIFAPATEEVREIKSSSSIVDTPVVTLEDELQVVVEDTKVSAPSVKLAKPVAAVQSVSFDDDTDWPDEYSTTIESSKAPTAQTKSVAASANGNSKHELPKIAVEQQAVQTVKADNKKIVAVSQKQEIPSVQAGIKKSSAVSVSATVAPTNQKSIVQTARGRLIGWLVSFADQTGQAIELREGKFFVTSNSIKPNDLVVDNETVSAPHAMLNVSLNNGVIVQDLLSEYGVHLKQAATAQYVQEEEAVRINHGDRVKFGNVEFLVTIIPDLAYT